ncbi:MAG TPA: hypothetical protein VHP38_06950 [Ruminiclostridium sp.]|nr:hypothetical protein [Ruminiclostridium sp.]
MFYTGRPDLRNFIAEDIGFLKNEYGDYYGSLLQEERSPLSILLCSALVAEKHNSFEKILLIYTDRIIVLKKVNGVISKYPIEYGNINYIVMEGLPHPGCLIIHFSEEGREKIFFDSFAEDAIKRLAVDLRKMIAPGSGPCNEAGRSIENMEDKSAYIGKTLAFEALFENQTCMCSLSQRRVYERYWSIFRKIVTQTHYSIVSTNEVLVFMEKYEPTDEKDICGDLIFIPLNSVKKVSLEATERGMIMKYKFNTLKTFELFYQNERTEELLQAMSFINGAIQS